MLTYHYSYYSTYHAMLKTDVWFEVYERSADGIDSSAGVALFANEQDAVAFIQYKTRELLDEAYI